MCLSQLEILAKRNLRNFSYSTWHWACLATSVWVICPPKGKSETTWHLYRGDFSHQELLPVYGTKPAFPTIAPVKQGSAQPAAERALPRIIVFPGKTAWPGYMLLSFSPPIHRPPQKWPFWSKSKRSGLQRKQKMSHSLKHFTWLLPPAPTRDLMGIECSQRWGRSLVWCQWPFSEKLRNSPAFLSWYKVGEEERINTDRWGKASQTWDWRSADWQ